MRGKSCTWNANYSMTISNCAIVCKRHHTYSTCNGHSLLVLYYVLLVQMHTHIIISQKLCNIFADDTNSSATISSKQYGAHDVNVTISLKLPQRYASYNVSITPHVPVISTTDGITHMILVKLSYNVKYNLSVEVIVPCRNNSITSFYLHYGEMHTWFDIHNNQT